MMSRLILSVDSHMRRRKLDARTLSPTSEDLRDETTVTLPIEGMTCASCVGRVERAIRQVPGVVDVSVNLATERAEVTFQEESADIGGVEDAVFTAGYKTARASVRDRV